MSPETIKKLRDFPEYQELVAFLSSELAKLYSIEDLDNISAADRVYRLEGKLRAYATLSAMLAPLLSTVDKPLPPNLSEYAA